jgi:phosphoglucosamine mutase
MSNIGLYKAFDELGIDYRKTDVGDKYVYECMSREGHKLGGEQSGHIIFSKYASTGDGLITAIKLMEVLLETKTSLSKLTEPLQIYPQITKNVRVKDKNAAAADSEVITLSEEINREFNGNGRLLVRKSGTEPLVRIMAEAETADICREVIGRVEALLEKNGHTI